MLPIREEISISIPKIAHQFSIAWLCLVSEFFIRAAVSGFSMIFDLVQSILSGPPRNLGGDVVLVTGVTTKLGKFIAFEFARQGCTIVCIDGEIKRMKKIVDDLRNKSMGQIYDYECDFRDRRAIKKIANRVENDIGSIDVLVTCAGQTGEDIFDSVSKTLTSHYWTVLAFLPSMLKLKKAHIIGVTAATSSGEACAGSRAAIAGLMESLSQEFTSRNCHLNFITVAPKAEPRFLKQTEEQIARELVQAVRRDQGTLYSNWFSTILYENRNIRLPEMEFIKVQ